MQRDPTTDDLLVAVPPYWCRPTAPRLGPVAHLVAHEGAGGLARAACGRHLFVPHTLRYGDALPARVRPCRICQRRGS